MGGAGDQTVASFMSVAAAASYAISIERQFQRRARWANELVPFGAERASCE